MKRCFVLENKTPPMNTENLSTKYNICVDHPIRIVKKGNPTRYYIIKCANCECENIIDVKPSVWEKNLKLDVPRIFSCSMNCKKSECVKKLAIEKNIEVFGYANIFQRPETKQKIRETNIKNLGVENPFQSDEVKQKIRETNIKNWGVDNCQKNPEIKQKTIETRNERYKDNLSGFVVKDVMYKNNLERYGNIYYFASVEGKMNKENFIRRYGEKEGSIKYEEYLKNKTLSLEKFIDKYGIEEGNIRYLHWIETSRQNLQNFIERHGEEKGMDLYIIFCKKRVHNLLKNGKYTKLNDFFEKILLDNMSFNNIFREKALFANNRAYYYDFCIFDKLFIEVQGDFWHCNPQKYKSDEIVLFPGNRTISVDQVWNEDLIKKNVAISQGYDIIYIWENELKKKILNNTIIKITEFIKKYENGN